MAKKTTDLDDILDVIGQLSNAISDRFDKLEIQVFKQGEDIKELKTDVAKLNKKVDHILQDNKARDYQQERMERWIFQLADASGVKLKYE